MGKTRRSAQISADTLACPTCRARHTHTPVGADLARFIQQDLGLSERLLAAYVKAVALPNRRVVGDYNFQFSVEKFALGGQGNVTGNLVQLLQEVLYLESMVRVSASAIDAFDTHNNRQELWVFVGNKLDLIKGRDAVAHLVHLP